MTASERGRTGVLIIRIWVEDPRIPDVRARIIESMDITAEEPVARSASSVEGISREVQDFVRAFVRSHTAA